MLSVKTGLIKGREHIRRSVNRQDSLKVITGEDYTIGFLSDGCSEGENSEVGTIMAVNLACSFSKEMLKHFEIDQIPNILFQKIVDFMKQTTAVYSFQSQSEYVTFIKDHLLFTLIGFIAFNDEVIIFSSGDGIIVIDEEITFLNQDNKPSYMSYHLIERKYLSDTSTEISYGFTVKKYSLKGLKRFAIGSDAWADEREFQLLQSEVWKLGENPRSLQRKMKIWSEKEKMFQDDASLITVEII